VLVQARSRGRLHLQGQLADLVQEQRSAVGLGEGAAPIRDGAGERAAHVAEQRRFDRSRDGAAVEHDERPVAARAVAVDLLGEQLLAGAGLAFQQHRGVVVATSPSRRNSLRSLGIAADQGAEHLVVDGGTFDRFFVGDVPSAPSDRWSPPVPNPSISS